MGTSSKLHNHSEGVGIDGPQDVTEKVQVWVILVVRKRLETTSKRSTTVFEMVDKQENSDDVEDDQKSWVYNYFEGLYIPGNLLWEDQEDHQDGEEGIRIAVDGQSTRLRCSFLEALVYKGTVSRMLECSSCPHFPVESFLQ